MKQTFLLFITCLLLHGNFAYAQIPTDVPVPDNIIQTDCYGSPPSSVWSFKELGRSSISTVSAVAVPLAGDVDNDGKIEVIVAGQGAYAATNRLYIFDDQLNIKYTVTLVTGTNPLSCSYSIADVDKDGYAEIYVCEDDGYLRKYSHNKQAYNGANFVFEKAMQHATSRTYYYAQPMITDFNGDGFPEVVVLDRVYDAITLDLLVDGNRKGSGDLGHGSGHVTTNNANPNYDPSLMAIGDVDGDNLPELIAGSTVYKITINSRTVPSLNTFTVFKQANARSDVGDGATAIADMDGDGQLDVIVSRRISATNAAIYIWNPRTGAIMNDNIINDLRILPRTGVFAPFGPSLPFIGDIDGDGKPEVIVISYRASSGNGAGWVTAYDFESGQLIKKTNNNWPLATSDYSAATVITLFDFNQDGSYELVYRDMSTLRIIDGATANTLATIVCTSATGIEYPIVVDFNNDGSAEILVTGALSGEAWGGYLRAFGSNGTKWAPARKVWNQYAYNAVNINEDLTVPTKQLNPSTRFAGDDTILGNADDVFPFNGYLMQQTNLNQYGEPLWPLPKPEIIGFPIFSYNDVTDYLAITINVKNIGEALFENPFYLTAYKNSIGGTPKHTHTYTNPILVGETTTITFGIADFGATWGTDLEMVISLNDDGNGSMNQETCGVFVGSYNFGFIEVKECQEKPVTLTNNKTLSGTMTYQWKSSTDGVTWIDITGATNSSYTTTNNKPGTYYYKVKVDNGTDTIDGTLTRVRIYPCVMPVNPNIHVYGEL